jgi:hypothetical protein
MASDESIHWRVRQEIVCLVGDIVEISEMATLVGRAALFKEGANSLKGNIRERQAAPDIHEETELHTSRMMWLVNLGGYNYQKLHFVVMA